MIISSDMARQDSHQYENLSCHALKDAYADTDVCMNECIASAF